MNISAVAHRARRAYIMYLTLGVVIFTLVSWDAYLMIQLHEYETMAAVQAGQLSVADAQIAILKKQVNELNQALDAARFESIISRGAERKTEVTAYTWTGYKTASGTWPKAGRTVAGPRNVPFGTVVWIEGVGERIIEDRMNERYPNRYDVYMDTEQECLEFGIRELIVK